MSGYTKLFHSILASTIWRGDDKLRIVWITMMAMADRYGVVEASIPGLADFARVSLEDCEQALDALQSPDKYSRSKEHDGRRIEAIDGGWRLLNHSKYREKMNADERREYLRVKQAEQRQKRKRASVNTQSTSVADRSGASTLSTHAEAEAEASPKATDLNLKDLPNPRVVAAEKTPDGGGNGKTTKTTPVNSRSKRPLHCGQRFTVFDWMLEDMGQILGPYLNDFDISAWFWELDARAVKQNIIVDKPEQWAWLRQELIDEAKKRGLPVGLPSAQKASFAATRAAHEWNCPHTPKHGGRNECRIQTELDKARVGRAVKH